MVGKDRAGKINATLGRRGVCIRQRQHEFCKPWIHQFLKVQEKHEFAKKIQEPKNLPMLTGRQITFMIRLFQDQRRTRWSHWHERLSEH